LVGVVAAGVTPTELVWYPTTHRKDGAARVGAVVGHEFSGRVAAVGAGVEGWRVGEAVFGMNDWFMEGATAEFCVTRPEWIARKPERLSHAEAASVPIGALTAWQGLVERAKVERGEVVLVQGGAGAVGLYAVQLARRAGARVVATASARHRELLTELGVERVIDYRTEKFWEVLRDVDVVFDGVGGETFVRSWEVIKPGGRVVTIAADVEGATDARAKGAFFIVEAKGEQLAKIGEMIERRELRVFVDAEVGFEGAGEAYAGRTKGRRGVGKVVVVC
jgi:NADPH:quinone reductase-like Zn-dependent oxidoreductase